jgi:hypothetical protein
MSVYFQKLVSIAYTINTHHIIHYLPEPVVSSTCKAAIVLVETDKQNVIDL